MIYKTFPSGPFSTNAYVIACEQTREAIVIDPAPGSFAPISEFLTDQHLILKKILLTHSHWDHIADIKSFKDSYHIPVYIHVLDEPNLLEPGCDGLPSLVVLTPIKPDHYLEEGKDIPLGNSKVQVIHTPGHSPGSVCFYVADGGLLFSGDTLFKGTIGNLSFPTSNPPDMWPSLEKLSKLPAETKILSGHGDETTIKLESSWLPEAKHLFGF